MIPDSQFNGNIKFNLLSLLVSRLVKNGFNVYLNVNHDNYDSLLGPSCQKIFLPYKDTIQFASVCRAVISVRCGLADCLHFLAFQDIKFFVIYNKQKYQHYKYFDNFEEWFYETYSFNNIPDLIQNQYRFSEYFPGDNFIDSIISSLTNA